MVVELMEDFVKDGSLFCKVSLDGSSKWLDCILLHVNLDKNLADIFISIRHFRSLISEGSRVIVKSMDEGQEYIIKGMVSSKVISMRKQSLTIEIEEITKLENHRIFARFDVNYPAIISEVSSTQTSSGVLFDISTGGIFMHSPTSFEHNTALYIEVYTASDGIIRFTGRILRKTTHKIGYSYGIVIEEIDHQNALQLNKLIQILLEDKKTLMDELDRFRRFKAILYMIVMMLLVGLVVYLSRLI
jgi:hypothetical protein